jgi:hypothetical protein
MVEEKRYDREEYRINLFPMESLTQQRNEMLGNFSQILQWFPTIEDVSSSSSIFGDTAPFKVQVNFDILVFEGHIDVDSLEKWLNFLDGYFFVHIFSNKENITFTLLKDLPHVQH